jgi:3D (Asp-Asp-Asp) domain-containing protein
MVLSRSLKRKVLATAIAGATFFLLYQATVIDSRSVPGARTAVVATGARLRFTATAYCKGTITASGATARNGVAAADPGVLPLGSIVRIDGGPDRHNGIYTVLDTGPAVQGREIDIYIWSCFEALDFGRRKAVITVLRLGWDPNNSAR